MIILLLLIMYNAGTLCAQQWQRVIENPGWEKRGWHRSVIFKDKMWVLNGKAVNDTVHKDVYSSNDGITWNLVHNPTPFLAKVDFALLVFDGKMWVICGEEGC